MNYSRQGRKVVIAVLIIANKSKKNFRNDFAVSRFINGVGPTCRENNFEREAQILAPEKTNTGFS